MVVLRKRSRLAVALAGAATAAVALALVLLAGAPADLPATPGQEAAPGITVSPSPGTAAASPRSEISFLGASAAQLAGLTVVGSRSGAHRGTLVPYRSARGASFVPAEPFTAGERVTVSARAAGISFSFGVTTPVTLPAAQRPAPAAATTARGAARYESEPGLHPPPVSVASATSAASGYVLVAPILTPSVHGPQVGQSGPLLLDRKGHVVWTHPTAPGTVAMNFEATTYGGRPALAWWQGTISQLGYGEGEDVIVDGSYRTVATVRAGNGYSADMHELRMTPRGAALITAYGPVRANLAAAGGPKDGIVLDSVVQMIDVPTGRVMFQWDPLGRVRLRESYAKPGSGAWDYFHANSVDVASNGDLLISARNTWALYRVDAHTGDVVWRLGGKRSDFKLPADARFAWQHDARFRGAATISLFDDEAEPRVRSQSRVLVLKLDRGARAARPVAEYTHPTPVLAGSQGNAQTLANGDVLVGWGAQPYVSEFSPGGALVFDARLGGGTESYRAFASDWHGRPSSRPAATARAAPGGSVVHASWNGATDVAAWQVLAGPDPSALRVVGSFPRTDFESSARVANVGPWFELRALDSSGRVIGRSAPVQRG